MARKGWKYYKQVRKQQGWKALVKEAGWPVAIGLFAFFLIKGLVWLAVFYGLFNFANSLSQDGVLCHSSIKASFSRISDRVEEKANQKSPPGDSSILARPSSFSGS